MNITHKDLNLLLVFHVLYQERNATLAAERMALSQPALSHKLNKLRHQFGDPLFVRAPRGLTPTPRAHEMAPQVQRLVEDLQGFYERCDGQDFLTRPARLHLYSTDYMEQTLLPRLLPIIRSQAPNLVLITHNTRGQLPREALEKAPATWPSPASTPTCRTLSTSSACSAKTSWCWPHAATHALAQA